MDMLMDSETLFPKEKCSSVRGNEGKEEAPSPEGGQTADGLPSRELVRLSEYDPAYQLVNRHAPC